jgi:putative oxidoreductase
MTRDDRLSLVLFLLRLSVFLVMLMWTIDKFVRPEHAGSVYENFYAIGGLSAGVIYLIGLIELAILIGFVLGYRKRWTYGAVLIFHAVSTLSSFRQYFTPFKGVNLLFYAAWPMLAACFPFTISGIAIRYGRFNISHNRPSMRI